MASLMLEKLNRKDAALVIAAAFIGYISFTTVPRLSALILAVPVLWTMAGSRLAAFGVILAYKLAASRGLLPGAAVFLSETHTFEQAAFLYFFLSFGASLPFFVFWARQGQFKALALMGAFAAAYILPPLSLIGIANPLMASGTIFRGWGFAGIAIVLTLYAICAMSRKAAYFFLCVMALFTVLPNDGWYKVPLPEGVIAVDTSFGKLGSGSVNFTQDYERANMVFDELLRRLAKGGELSSGVVVLPETIAGRLNDTGKKLWRRKIQEILPDRTVVFGAELPSGDGRKYDNAAVMLHEDETIVSRQRIPVPYSMYRGPFAETGANLRLMDKGIFDLPDGRKAAVIICYEAFLSWPVLYSAARSPDMLIFISNLWWCRETPLPVVLETIVFLWALTFGVPAVSARNI